MSKSGWTRITDAPDTLPPECHVVLVWDASDGHLYIGAFELLLGQFCWFEVEDVVCKGGGDWKARIKDDEQFCPTTKATHWHPLPALPEREGTE